MASLIPKASYPQVSLPCVGPTSWDISVSHVELVYQRIPRRPLPQHANAEGRELITLVGRLNRDVVGLAWKAGLGVLVILSVIVISRFLPPQYQTGGGASEGVANGLEVRVAPPPGSLVHVRDYHLVINGGLLSEIVVQIYNADRPLRVHVHVYFYGSAGELICRARGHYDVMPPGATVSVDVPDLEISKVSVLVIELRTLPSLYFR